MAGALFCAICGGPLRPPRPAPGQEWIPHIKWHSTAELLSDPSGEFDIYEQHYRAGKKPGVPPLDFLPSIDIRRNRVTVVDAELCILKHDGAEIRSNWGMGYHENTHVPHSTRYSIAVHEMCVDITMRAMRTSFAASTRVRSMRTLWRVLRMRFDARDNEYMGSVDASGPLYVEMDHAYYMPRHFADVYSDRDGDVGECWFLVDPSNIPDLTSQILSNLGKLDTEPPSPAKTAFGERFLALPSELRDSIVAHMCSFKDMPTECTRLITQDVWRDMLLCKKYLPYLWDLDVDAVEQHLGAHVPQGVELDWELLFRKLSQGLIWRLNLHPGTMSDKVQCSWFPDLTVPDGLRGRRRIWQLVEDMFVGDVLPKMRHTVASNEVPSMPRYWDEDGSPVYPVVRLAGMI